MENTYDREYKTKSVVLHKYYKAEKLVFTEGKSKEEFLMIEGKKRMALLISLIMVLSLFSRFFAGTVYAEPAENEQNQGKPIEVEITKFDLRKEVGSATPLESISYYEKFFVAIEWDATKLGSTIKEGDYYDFSIGNKLQLSLMGNPTTIPLAAPDGKVIANAIVTSGSTSAEDSSVRIIFTKEAEGKEGIKGTLFIKSEIQHSIIEGGKSETFVVKTETKTLEFEVEVGFPEYFTKQVLQKWFTPNLVSHNGSENKYIAWAVRISYNSDAFDNVTNIVLKDKLSATGGDMTGIRYLEDSFILKEFKKVDGKEKPQQVGETKSITADKISFNPEKTAFTLDLTSLISSAPIETNLRYWIVEYKTTYKKDIPGFALSNNVELTISSKTWKTSKTFKQESGGSSQYLVEAVTIIKVDAEDTTKKLPDAEFTLKSTKDGKVWTLKTAADGTVTSEQLPVGEYILKEIAAPDGYILDDAESTVVVKSGEATVCTVTNTKKPVNPPPPPSPATTSVRVNKLWDDANDQDGLRPDSITVQLYANGIVIDTITLNAANMWTVTFNDLPVNTAEGTAIVYTVEETVPEGYTKDIVGNAAADSFTITNTHTPETTSVSVSKVWDDANDQDGLRPDSITVQLLANGMAVKTLTLSADNMWTGTFSDLPVNDQGLPIVYTVDETVPEGYTKDIVGNAAADSFIITNTHTPATINIPVEKQWVGANDTDKTEVTIQLKKGGQVQKILKLNAANGWKDEFKNLPKLDGAGQPIQYAIDEIAVAGFTKKIVLKAAGDIAQGVTVTNSKAPVNPPPPPSPATTSVSVSKVWDDADNQDGLRPDSITVQLYANGIVIKTLTLSAANKWTGTFSDLPVNTAEGTAIVYTVDETEVPGYTKAIAASAAADDFIITNTHTPATISVNVNKVWVDANNQDGLRPASVTIKLLADGADTGKTVVLNAYNNWMGSFSNLAEYQAGKAISYSVREVPIGKGYTAKITGSQENGFLITNTRESGGYGGGGGGGDGGDSSDPGPDPKPAPAPDPAPKPPGPDTPVNVLPPGNSANLTAGNDLSVSVNKVWLYSDNRPGSVSVQLYRDGAPYGGAIALSEGNNWGYTWNQLENGHTWTVDEINSPSGYIKTVTHNGNAWTITNERILDLAPQNGDDSHMNIWLALAALSMMGLLATVLSKRYLLRRNGK